MEEIVLKREASVTSAEALDQINAAYPNSEILSFRKIKEAGNSTEFFITRVRFAAINDEVFPSEFEENPSQPPAPSELEEPSESEEEEKLDKIIDMLKKLVDEEKSEQKDIEQDEIEFEVPAPMKDDHEAKPLPKPQEPPFGVGGMGDIGSGITPTGSLIVERKANVSKSLARLELIREFAPEYKIVDIKKQGKILRATLYKIGQDNFGDPDEYEGSKGGPLDAWYEQQYAEQKRRQAESDVARERMVRPSDIFAEKDALGLETEAPLRFPDELSHLSPYARQWLEFLDEAGVPGYQIVKMQKFMEQLSPAEQGKWIEQQVSDVGPSTGFGIAPPGTGPKGKPGRGFEGEMDPSFVKGDKEMKERRIVLPKHLQESARAWQREKKRPAGKVESYPVVIRELIAEKKRELGNDVVSDVLGLGQSRLKRVPPASQEAWLNQQLMSEEERAQSTRKRQSIGDVDITKHDLGQIVQTMGDIMTPEDAYRLFDQSKKLRRTQGIKEKLLQEDIEKGQAEAPAEVAVMDPEQQQQIEQEALTLKQQGYEQFQQGNVEEANKLYRQAELVRTQLGGESNMPKGRPAR